jgi:hypothetical protein
METCNAGGDPIDRGKSDLETCGFAIETQANWTEMGVQAQEECKWGHC